MVNHRLLHCSIVSALLLLVASPLMAFSAGSGTPEDPYEIGSPAQWQELVINSAYWNQHFKLVDNINLSGVWPVEVATRTTPFTGSLDGQNYTISNVEINLNTRQRLGLFAWVGSAGQIRNLKIQNASITGYYYVGALAGRNDGSIVNCTASGTVRGGIAGGLVGGNAGSIVNCAAQGTVTTAPNAKIGMGGLVGENSGMITDCSANSTVSGNSITGGLVSSNYGTITRCFAEGTASATSGVGGLAGQNMSGATITESYAKTRVIGGDEAGGLVGQNTGTVDRCSASGQISGGSKVGGLIGSVYGSISNCYAHGPVSGNLYVGGLAGWVADSSLIFTVVDRCYSTGSVTGTGPTCLWLDRLCG